MLLEYHQGTLGPEDPDGLRKYLKIAENLNISRQSGESDKDYTERAIRISRMSGEIQRLFDDGTWDIMSVVDSITLSLANIVSTNYIDDDSETIDSYVTTVLADRIRHYRSELGQDPLPEWSDDDVLEFIKKFRLIDRPTNGKDSEKIAYARRVIKVMRTIESALVAANVTDFDAIEAFCAELAVIFGKSPLPQSMVKSLIERILVNSKLLKDTPEV